MTQAQVNALYPRPGAAPLTDRATEGLYPTGSTFKIITALAALESGVITPSTTIVRQRRDSTVGGQSFQNAGGASYGPLTLVPALQVSSDVFFYDLGLKMWDTGELQQLGAQAGDRRGRPGSTCRASAEGLLPTQEVARPALRGRRNRTALVGRRQHPAGDRPGRPADQPAADGDRLRRARQRRHDRHPARRHGSRGRRRPGAEGIRPAAAAPRPHRPRLPQRRSWKACTRRRRAPAAPPYGVFGGFPMPSRRQDRDRGTTAATPTSPGTRSSPRTRTRVSSPS